MSFATQMKKSAQEKLNDAFAALLQAIGDGVEYPDALWKVSYKHKVSYETLQEMYDNQ